MSLTESCVLALDWYQISDMTSNGVKTADSLLCVITLNALDFKANYVKVVEDKPNMLATKMWPNESSFWQYMTHANIRGDYGERVC